MIATFKPCCLAGTIDAPPSKSLAHRYLIGAALSGETCVLSGMDYSEDILASMDCLKALGAGITTEGDSVRVEPAGFMQADAPVLECRESGSTLGFLLPLALCLRKPVTLRGSARLLQRPLEIYEELCRENGFSFQKTEDSVTVCGDLKSGHYTLRGDVSSQFITGLIFALIFLGADSAVRILPPFESRPYVDLTISALRSFGARVAFEDAYTITIQKSRLRGWSGKVEGDYSNAAVLDAFNQLTSQVSIRNLKPDSL